MAPIDHNNDNDDNSVLPPPSYDEGSKQDITYKKLLRNLYKNIFYHPGTTTEEQEKIKALLMGSQKEKGFILSDGRTPIQGVAMEWDKPETLAVLYVKKEKEILRFDISFGSKGIMVNGENKIYWFDIGNLAFEEGFTPMLKGLAKAKVINQEMVNAQTSEMAWRQTNTTPLQYLADLHYKRTKKEEIKEKVESQKSMTETITSAPKAKGTPVPASFADKKVKKTKKPIAKHIDYALEKTIISPFERTKRRFLNRVFRNPFYHPGVTYKEQEKIEGLLDKANDKSFILSDGRALRGEVNWHDPESLAVLYVKRKKLLKRGKPKRYDILFNNKGELVVYSEKKVYGPYKEYADMLAGLEERGVLDKEAGIRNITPNLNRMSRTYDSFVAELKRKRAEHKKETESSLPTPHSPSKQQTYLSEADDVPPIPAPSATLSIPDIFLSSSSKEQDAPPPYPVMPSRPKNLRFKATEEAIEKHFLTELFENPFYHPSTTESEQEALVRLLRTQGSGFVISEGREPKWGTVSSWKKGETLAVLYVQTSEAQGGEIQRYDITCDAKGLSAYGDPDQHKKPYGPFLSYQALYQGLAEEGILNKHEGIRNTAKITQTPAQWLHELDQKRKQEKEEKPPSNPGPNPTS